MSSVVAVSEQFAIALPTWGRSFWQDPNDGELFLAFVSGNTQAAFITSSDSGNTWSSMQAAFPVENFFVHNNFDTEMDEDGNIHCVYRLNGSGCYTVLGKNAGGGWAASGVPVRGFADVGDTGLAKGFNGMVAVYSTFSSDPSWWGGGFGTRMSANIVLKNSSDEVVNYRVPDSGLFSEFPVPVVGFNALPRRLAGPDGGFPVFTDAGGIGFGNGPAVSWSVDATGLAYAGRESSFSSAYTFINNFPIDGTEGTPETPLNTPTSSGYLGRAPFNPNMSFGRAVVDRVHPIIASIDNGKFFVSWDLYTTAYEPDILASSGPPSNSVFIRVAGSSAFTTNSPTSQEIRVKGFDSIGTIPWCRAITQGAPPVPVKSINSDFVQGTPSSISHGDEPGVHKIYFQTTDQAGQQVISRLLCGVQSETDNDEQTRFFFSPLTHPASGLRSFAPAGLTKVGGSGLTLNWNGFKSLQHPTLPGVGVTKKDIVVTAGRSFNPSNRLVVWDFDKSIEATQPLKVPTFSRELTKDSGVIPTFGTKRVFGPTYTGAKVAQLFDGDLLTNVSHENGGDGFVLEFDQPVAFTRVEFVRSFSSSIDVHVSGSLDDIEYFPATSLFGGNLTKNSSEYDVLGDSTVDKYIDPFVAKYLKVGFGENGNRSITEFRLYGYHTTVGKTTSGPGRTDIGFEFPPGVPFVEEFNTLHEGDVPLGWTVSGDWNWGAQASGIYARANSLPTSPLGNGKVKVGQFAGNSIGNSDGFAMRTLTGMPNNSSGVLETEISIGSDELNEDGASGRTIKFDVRYYLFGVNALGGPDDDAIRFFIVPEFGGPFDGEQNVKSQTCLIHVCDWHTVKFNIAPGNYTLKWVFERKDTDIVTAFPKEEPVAWIDNIVGLDGSVNFLGGLPPASINGVMFAANNAITSVNAYMENPPAALINAYMSGGSPFEPINAYTLGMPDVFASVNGYLLGMKQAAINAIMVGGDGLGTLPTGIIHGHIATNSGIISSVNGYILGMKQAQVHGYLPSVGEVSGVINSYLNSDYHFSSVLGRLGPSGEVATTQVLGYLPARTFESVNAYLINAGATTNILGFVPGQNSASVNAYMFTPNDSGNAQVYGYVANTVVAAPVVNAWISGASVFTPINGYLINDGKTSEINGYLNVQDNSQINGYMQGRDLTDTQVNAYMSGLGFIDTQVNGYLFGVSGIIDENINGFMIGEGLQSEMINGYIIGHEDACESHGTVPLPVVPTGFVIPSTCFNNGV